MPSALVAGPPHEEEGQGDGQQREDSGPEEEEEPGDAGGGLRCRLEDGSVGGCPVAGRCWRGSGLDDDQDVVGGGG